MTNSLSLKTKSVKSKRSGQARTEAERARESLTRYLALRDHSRQELKTKLSRRYEDEIVALTLAWAEQHQLLAAEEDISRRMSQQLARKLKSHRQIQGSLRNKGLPGTSEDTEGELEKIRQLLQKRFRFEGKLSYEEQVKAYRYLKYRGFNDRLIKQVLHEKP